MKGTEQFTRVIADFLNERAMADPLFAKNLNKEDKNIDDCVTYILNKVKQSGCNGFADEEVFSMALHYYDEDDIEVGKATKGNVVVNHHIELTEEEKQEARKKALAQYQEEQLRKMNAPLTKKRRKVVEVQEEEPNLFDF